MRFQVKFQTFGGSNIDLDALKVTYLKSPVVDLTPRIKPFAQATGIDMPDAQLPPGEHLVRVDVKDSEGRDREHQLPAEDRAVASMPCPFCKDGNGRAQLWSAPLADGTRRSRNR